MLLIGAGDLGVGEREDRSSDECRQVQKVGLPLVFVLTVQQGLKTRRISFHVLQRGDPQMLESGQCRDILA